jgi:hexulose-6-phosphate isomerase
MKLALMQLAKPGEESAQFLSARRQGFDGVQPCTSPETMNDSRLDALRQAANESGLEIPSIALLHHIWSGGFLTEMPDGRRQVIEDLRMVISWASDLGAKVILVPGFVKAEPKSAEDIAKVIAGFREVCPLAEKAGVKLAYEHPLASTEFLSVLDHVGSPALGDYYDIANLDHSGLNNSEEISQRGSRIFEIHLKNYREVPWDSGLRGGRVDLDAAARAIRATHYSGWFVIESANTKDELLSDDAALAREVFSEK